MIYALFLFLLKATLCLVVFSTAYQWFFSKFAHFQGMRVYLLGSVVLSICLPLLQIPVFAPFSFFTLGNVATETGYLNYSFDLPRAAQSTPALSETAVQGETVNLFPGIGYLLLIVYFAGVLYKMCITGRHLFKIRQMIVGSHKVKEGNNTLVYLKGNYPAFSFLHYIFLNPDFQQLSADEQQQVKQHEQVHVRQKHTLDLLFFEIAGALFWFNPLITYLKNALQEVHEYLADAEVANASTQKTYAHLLLKLATQPRLMPLANSISGKQIGRRIMMLTHARSLPRQKFVYLLILPLVAMMVVLNACMDEPATNTEVLTQEDVIPMDGKKIRNIIWGGNTVYDDETLNREFGLKSGDWANEELINKHLNYNPDGSDLSSLYMDNGYLFFSIDVEENQVGDKVVDLVLNVFEGPKVKVDNVIIKGNQTVPTSEIRAQIPIESGDLFNRSKLIEAQKNIAAMGYFDPQQVGINPYPHWSDQEHTVLEKMELEFTVIETNPKK